MKVLDFGLAKVATPDSVGSDPSQSRAGAVFGTAAYMSPEQARGTTLTSAPTSGHSVACSSRC